MFDLRCLSVSLAFFLLSYCLISAVVAHSWGLAAGLAKRLSARRWADLLFILRCLPLVASGVVTLAFVVPSFILLEPRISSEPVGEVPLFLGICCLTLFAAGVWNAARAHARTSETVANWMSEATAVRTQEQVAIFRIRPDVPALTVAGICAPKILLSNAAAQVLTATEFQTALRHEVAHVRQRDNLKKLFFRLLAFPGMAKLESVWGEAEEIAADDSAVRSVGDALDLASALIKLSRFAPVQPSAALTTALVNSPTASVNARVARLLSWNEAQAGRRGLSLGFVLLPLLGAVAFSVAVYGPLLSEIHSLTEFLVR